MQINVYGNNSPSQINDNKKVTSLFPQEPYLKTNYIEINIEDNIDLKNQFRIKNLKAQSASDEQLQKNMLYFIEQSEYNKKYCTC